MKVTIKFYAGFEKYLQNNSNKVMNLTLNDRKSILSILTRFLPEEEINFAGVRVLVNKKITSFSHLVTEGDHIEVLPIIDGG